jgi:hypothetical protein
MTVTSAVGWTAASLMLLTFLCQGPRSLRATAALASCAFIAYGALADLLPVLVLHSLLLGVNLRRLWQLRIRCVGRQVLVPAPVGTHGASFHRLAQRGEHLSHAAYLILVAAGGGYRWAAALAVLFIVASGITHVRQANVEDGHS